MEAILFLPILATILLSLIAIPKWIEKAKKFGFVGKNMNSYKHEPISEGGGLAVIFASITGILIYVAIIKFYFQSDNEIIYLFATIISLLLLAFLGLVDGTLGWKIGLSKRFRILFCCFAAIPLIVINSGVSTIYLPWIGKVSLGLIYPFLLVPLAIVGTSTTFNFLAGFNGLEAGQGIIILSFLSFIAYRTNNSWLAIIWLIIISSLIVFYFFNKYPAKVFPGDVLTYPLGGMIGIMAILGNFERIALFIFIPYIIEVILKIKGGLQKQSFGIPDKNNNLSMPYDKIYGLTHLSIFILSKFKKEVKEKDVTYFIFSFQIIICILALIIFRKTIFNY